MSSADEFLFKETVDPTETEVVSTDKRIYQVLDQNGGSYNGQILFDTSTLSNSGQWLAYSEAYIQIPFVITVSTSADLDAANPSLNSFTAGLKSGYYQLIDSVQVEYNNTTVAQLQPFSNLYMSYKVMTSYSADDLKKWGPTLGVAPDNGNSYGFSAAASTSGDGYYNNIVNPYETIRYGGQADAKANTRSAIIAPTNAGYYQRLQYTGFPAGVRSQAVANSNATGAGYNGLTVLSDANCNTIAKNYAVSSALAQGANNVVQWTILATIRFKDLATSFFDKLPLVRGASMRITVNYNSSTTVITNVAAGTTSTLTSVVMNSGRTNPIMYSSGLASNPNAGVQGINNVLTFRCNVAGVGIANRIQAPQISQCRIYVPAYTLNPIAEKNLITVNPIREVKYNDIYNYNVLSVTSGSSFTAILTNGIINPKYLVVLPYANSAAGVFATYTGPVYTSPYDSAPATTTPLASITQFQVQVAGQNMFQQNFQYDFETFINETSAANAINGGLSTGMTSGLIGFAEWDSAYRYYVCDLSRRVPSEDGVAKSVVLSGINSTAIRMDYYTFIVYERVVKIDMRTGLLAA